MKHHLKATKNLWSIVLMENKKCALILPYFGKFNNYFDLFLLSFSKNQNFDLLIFTDNLINLEYDNIKIFNTSLSAIKAKAEKIFGFTVSLNTPYKLCDYKPAYGLLFEKYLTSYDYWGHCDCDLIFGNLDRILIPILEQEYDKIFAAGHLTLYKNTKENNRRFMKSYRGNIIYKDAFSQNEIYVFDEDCVNHDNVHYIFKEDNAKVFETDLSMNVCIKYGKFIRDFYDEHKHTFVQEEYVKRRYYWSQGDLFSLELKSNSSLLLKNEYLYMHLQKRKIFSVPNLKNIKSFEILPDRFYQRSIPKSKKEFRSFFIGFPYLFYVHKYFQALKRRIKLLGGNKSV